MSVEERRAEINQAGKSWVVATIAIIASILISASNNKLPATMSLVIPALGIDTGTASNIMSLNGYVGLVLAFVAASIIMKFGTKKSTLMVLVCATVGAIISAFATDYLVLVIGRLIEGVGYACIGTVIPVLFSEWFPPTKRGVPMGIFSVWVPLGSMFVMGTSGFFFNEADPSSYHAVFWFVVVLLAIITVVWALAVHDPRISYLEQEGGQDTEKPKVSEGFKSLSCWVAMVAFAAFSLGTACVMNFETLYMVQTMGMEQASANGMLNVANIAVVIGGVGIGFVMNAVKSNKGRLGILVVCSAVLGACFAVAYTVNESLLIPWLIVFGLSNGVVPAIFFTMVAEIAPRPALASVSSTLMSAGQCIGGIMFAIVGAVITAAGWAACTGLLVGVGVVLFLGSLALFFVLRARDVKRAGSAATDPAVRPTR